MNINIKLAHIWSHIFSVDMSAQIQGQTTIYTQLGYLQKTEKLKHL